MRPGTLRFLTDENVSPRLVAPYLPPQAFRGQRNEPAHLLHTAQEVAKLLNMPPTELGRLTTDNARRLLRLPPLE
ncbi:TatD family hydrolase [Candidatus Methylomirabilis limnetica]|uniref:TatD family hydrolase n=1 Tax=Candidatus Methylomirabilis limnetica TaxID=2033718 RepID=UPI00137B3E6C|nr:TatD family hydrolase [Candidatus Methylomirabilis limnetica]